MTVIMNVISKTKIWMKEKKVLKSNVDKTIILKKKDMITRTKMTSRINHVGKIIILITMDGMITEIKITTKIEDKITILTKEEMIIKTKMTSRIDHIEVEEAFEVEEEVSVVVMVLEEEVSEGEDSEGEVEEEGVEEEDNKGPQIALMNHCPT